MIEYAKRRKALMRHIGHDAIVLMPSAPEVLRNGDAQYPYRQNSDFYYLTGFNEPEAVAILSPKNDRGEYILFNRVRNPKEEVWNGPRAGQEGARKHYLADHAFSIQDLEIFLPTLIGNKKTLYYPMGLYKDFDAFMIQLMNQLQTRGRHQSETPLTLVDVQPLIHELRLFKSPAEVALMQKAADISVKTHQAAMRYCQPGRNECELDAVISFEFKKQGALSPAYTSIVGAGENTCVLHYIQNDKKIQAGDLVLIDAGAEYENYAADITRTFPANGRFTEEQAAIYDIVLRAQEAAIALIKPGITWPMMQDAIIKVITQGLIKLGILKGNWRTLVQKKAYLPFYMHQSGHWLGLDVHDAGCYKIKDEWRQLKPGMVLTVEPGIYIHSSIPGVAKRWHDIGVRIEDDVLVTKTGAKVLSAALPKTRAAIEALMAK